MPASAMRPAVSAALWNNCVARPQHAPQPRPPSEFHGRRRVSWHDVGRDHNTAADRPAVAQHAQARPGTTFVRQNRASEASPGAARPWCAYVPAINKL